MRQPAVDALIGATRFDAGGLVPVIVQDAATGVVRMFAWAHREALSRTAETGEAHFFSRSRQALWRKGETSGNVLHVRDIRLDCDGDVVLYVADAVGPSCHTGHTSCFYRSAAGTAVGEALSEDDGPEPPAAVMLTRVAEVIARRRRDRPEKSYVVSLLDAGWPKILGKIREESGELADALPEGDVAHTAHEAADLLFHMLVGLEAANVPMADVFDQLRRRFGVSGIDEKARRPKVGDPVPSAPEHGRADEPTVKIRSQGGGDGSEQGGVEAGVDAAPKGGPAR